MTWMVIGDTMRPAMRLLFSVLGSIFCVFLASCSPRGSHIMPNSASSPTSPNEPTIGSVTMEEGSDIVLTLHKTADGIFAEAQFRYRPGTPEYENVISHVGRLATGESKLVPP
jgi:hypothetical protein